jgi:hypothetical protein
MANIGRILVMPKGRYLANATYEMLDMVSYNGKAWICRKPCTGVAPSEESEYWQIALEVTAEGIEGLADYIDARIQAHLG